jgi:hypothetical protein
MIIWDKPLDALTRFSIRAFLRDDAYRLSNDLKRIWLQDRTDVLFDEKIITQDWIDGQIKRLKKEIQTCYDEINELNKKMPMQYNASTWEEVK